MIGAAGGYFMDKLIMIVMAACLMATASFAQTPVGRVVKKYENVKGAQDFYAKGGKLNLVRGLIRKTPVGPIADDIEELVILKMAKAPQHQKSSFMSDLKSALGSYEYCGTESYDDGTYEIYILRSGKDMVKDLVIYNPAVHSLNSLRGTIPVSALEKLAVSYGR